MIAEMWKLLLESEGIPTRILPVPDRNSTGSTGVPPVEMKEFVPYRILVPQFRVHVYEEIIRKL